MADSHAAPQSLPSQDQFIERLITEKNYPALEPEVKQQMKEDLKGRLQEYLNTKLIAQLNDKKVEELNELLKQNSEPEMVNQFFNNNIPNVAAIIASEYLNFRALYLGLK